MRYHCTLPEWLKLNTNNTGLVRLRNTGDSNILLLGLYMDIITLDTVSQNLLKLHTSYLTTMVVFLGIYLLEMFKYMHQKHAQ